MIKIATFDVIPVDGVMEFIEKYVHGTDDSAMIPEVFHNFNYSSTDPIQNLEIIFLVLAALLIAPIIMKLVELICSCNQWASNRVRNFKTTVLYWNTYLRFFLEAFLELSIACLLRVKSIRVETTDDIILTAFAAILVGMLSAFMVASPFYLTKHHKKIKTDEFVDRFGALTLGLQYRDIAAMYYPFMFMLRRLIFAMVFVYLSRYNFFQIQIVVFKSSILMAFQGQVKPFYEPA